MQKFIISLALIFIGLVVGQVLRYFDDNQIIPKSFPTSKYVKYVQNFALLFLNPIIVIGAFWVLKIVDAKLIAIPVLGLGALILGGILGFLSAKLLSLDKKQTGSLFVSASFTNIGSFGGLICFIFFGEMSYAFVSMYKIFEELYYYTIGFPIAKAHGNTSQEKKRLLHFILDPYILAAVSSIIVGIILNRSGIPRPEIYSSINNLLIPTSSLLLVASVGYRMRFTAVKNYIKESLTVSVIKFAIVPLTITTVAYFLGLGQIAEGLPLKVVLVLSAMPPAFNSLIPPQIYDLDGDLANSSWLFNTAALVVVLPILYFIQTNI